MSGKSKRGREVRKPKQTPKPKPAKEGTDISRALRQAKLPRGGVEHGVLHAATHRDECSF